ncbi:MAG: hypothetical protein EHM42_13230, partial [Planctomycetaceae bacterium]
HIDGTARFWPLVGTEAVTNTLAVGQLNPDDLDRFDLGREPERKAFHRSWDHRHLVNWLDLASRAQPRRKLAQGRHTDVIWNAVVGYTESLRKDLQPQEVIAELEQIAGELADRGDVSSQVLAALAGGFRRCGDFRTAQRLIQQVLERRDFSTPQLMADWAVLGLGPLGQTPTELLRQWVRIDQPAADDVRWLLDRLAAGEPIRINAGGENYDAADGAHWRHDCFFRGGYRFGETLGQPPIADVVIADTPHPPLYQTERWFDVGGSAEERGYHIPVPPGRYRVVIHFAEIWHMAPEFRTVAVVAEGHDGGCRFDSEQTGFARPATCELVAEVDDGELNLEFKSIRRSPKVSAFEIFRLKD